MNKELLKKLPKMDDLINHETILALMKDGKRTLVMEALRESLENTRALILSEKLNDMPETAEIIAGAVLNYQEKMKMNLHPVINGTGIILHTNLGRAQLSQGACEAVSNIGRNYSTLEYDPKTGKRGTRYAHVIDLLKKLTAAEDALVVNNNAAAMWLILNTMAKNKRVLISRGELVEIGGQFRIPDIMAESGSILVEVGTTNKTHVSDYENQIDGESILLKVHTSNYRLIGFTEEVQLADLKKIANNHGIPLIYDLGSGSLINFENFGISGEPFVKKSVTDGADIVCFSGDKLLGGPQAGIIIGQSLYIEKMKKNPLTRALRIDKLTLAALEYTLREYLDESQAVKNIPVLSQILAEKNDLRNKAENLFSLILKNTQDAEMNIINEYGQIGGGSMPGFNIETFAISINPKNISVNLFEERLRRLDRPIISRISKENVLLDVLTLEEKDFDYIARGVADCLKSEPPVF